MISLSFFAKTAPFLAVLACRSGYDLNQLYMGSEGTLGVIVELVVRLLSRVAALHPVAIPIATC